MITDNHWWILSSCDIIIGDRLLWISGWSQTFEGRQPWTSSDPLAPVSQVLGFRARTYTLSFKHTGLCLRNHSQCPSLGPRCRLGWLASELQGSSCLYLPHTGFQGCAPTAPLLWDSVSCIPSWHPIRCALLRRPWASLSQVLWLRVSTTTERTILLCCGFQQRMKG